ncbi:YeeE/YedE family protein [Vibrio sinaloensis]|uniref:YeeE/YedE family protein n=1 Tax=Photobacterium sp. (strain ATCC 43367) TaxID=379097 RepID=UPI002A63E7C8|nr:YeeE/YedE family protein [Vibrio sinaloensis]
MLETIPWESLLGGVALGVSATLLLLMNGKVAGISGIVNGLMLPRSADYAWRVLFVLGMVLGGVVSVMSFGVDTPSFDGVSLPVLVVAGALVGFGTRLANGCTSGHGICGVGRLSKRSIIATMIFMLVAALTVYVRLHWFSVGN